MSYNSLLKIKHFESEFLRIKQEAGSHSPSMGTLKKTFPELSIDVDACFLSNPYATDLIMEYLYDDMVKNGSFRNIIEHYPSQQASVRHSLAKRLGVNENNLFLGNGATEIIQTLLHTYTHGKMVLPIPTFSSYYEFANDQTQVVYYELKKENDYEFDIGDFLWFVKKEKPSTVVLINPNNPNGSYIDLASMRELLCGMKDVEQVIIDESFIHFAFEDEQLSLVDSTPLFKEFDNVIIVKSLSKDFGIAGVRIGYALMESSRVERLLNNGFLWNLNGIAEYILKLIGDDTFFKRYENARKKYIKEAQHFFRSLNGLLDLYTYPSKANFALIELPSGMKASFFVAALLCEYGIYVRTAGDKVGVSGECVRISVRRGEENRRILKAVEEVLSLWETSK